MRGSACHLLFKVIAGELEDNKSEFDGRNKNIRCVQFVLVMAKLLDAKCGTLKVRFTN